VVSKDWEQARLLVDQLLRQVEAAIPSGAAVA
jgi:hypothetical protein